MTTLLQSLEVLDSGKLYGQASVADVPLTIKCYR